MIFLSLLAPAFISGLLMFLAPCTLPMIPGYLAFISGVSNKEISNLDTRSFAESKIRKNSIFFVLGFSTVFVLVGVIFGLFGSFLAPIRSILLQVSGAFVILFSLVMLGVVPNSLFVKTSRFKLPSGLHIGTPQSSFIVGSIFAFGFSPCVGPILGTVLVLVGTASSAFQGGLLLAVFCLGFSIPFLVSAFAYHRAQDFFKKHAKFLRGFSLFGGLVMLLIGILLFINEWSFFQEIGFKIFKFIEYERLQEYL